MKLRDYLRENKISVAKFSQLCEIPIPSMRSWVYGDKLPRPDAMNKIYGETQGKVTPNDFILSVDDEGCFLENSELQGD